MKTKKTKELEQKLIRTTNGREFICLEVGIGKGGYEIVDALSLDLYGNFKCYEIKVSKKDFHSISHLSFYGNYNYFVMTKELYDEVKSEIPNHIGVYIPMDDSIDKYRLYCIKKSRRVELNIDKETMFYCIVRSLYREATRNRFTKLKQALKIYYKVGGEI